MSLPDLNGEKTYADGNILTEQDLDTMFIDELHSKFFNQTSTTLADNTSSATAIFSVTASSNTAMQVEYSLTRGSGNIETGMLYLVNDGTNADVTGAASSLGTLGVTFSADINSGNVRLLYTTTSTGTAVTMKYRKWSWTA